jgi:alpha-beta hydrolase superfamily lysophospholipase
MSATATPSDGLYRSPPMRGDEALGSVLRSEDLRAPDGMLARAILYVSTGFATARTAVSGIVLASEGPARSVRRQVLAWAHFTAGLADRCAPSRAGVTDELLAIARPFLADGFVVVATDYEGLGTPGPHPYVVGVSEGRSVLDSVRAAQHLVGSGGRIDVAVLGLSQGGHAALWAAELAPTYAPEMDIRAVAAVAPGGDLAGIARWAFGPEGTPVGRLNVVMALSAWHEIYGLPLDAVLTANGRALATILQTTCPDDSVVPREQPLAADPGLVPGWREQVAANTPGASRAVVPILVVQGTRDEQVPFDTTLSAVRRLRDIGDDVELRVLEGGDHESSLFGPGRLDEIHAWIVERVGDSGTDRTVGATSGVTGM